MARLGVRDDRLVDAVAIAAASLGYHTFPLCALSGILWSLATTGSRSQGAQALLEGCTQAAAALAAAPFKPDSAAGAMWALAKLGCGGDAQLQLVQRLSQAVLRQIAALGGEIAADGEANGQTLANVLWSLAKLDLYPQAEIPAALHATAHAGLYRYSPHSLATIMWSLAQLRHRDDAFLAAWGRAVRGQGLVAWTAQGLSNAVWACAWLGTAPLGFLEIWAAEVERRSLASFTSQVTALWLECAVNSQIGVCYTDVVRVPLCVLRATLHCIVPAPCISLRSLAVSIIKKRNEALCNAVALKSGVHAWSAAHRCSNSAFCVPGSFLISCLIVPSSGCCQHAVGAGRPGRPGSLPGCSAKDPAPLYTIGNRGGRRKHKFR